MTFDLRVICLGAGVQSSTLYLMAATGEIERPDVAIFADTQCESPWVYEQVERLEHGFGHVIPIRRATLRNLGAQALRSRDGLRWDSIPFSTPSPRGNTNARLERSCTRTYKIEVVKRQIRAEVGPGRKRAEEWVGISVDEAHRAKPSRYRWITSRWPLLDLRMNRNDCVTWLKERGLPVPRKSACVFCPFRSDAEWIRMRDQEPDVFRQAVEFDAELRRGGNLRGCEQPVFVHKSLRPLGEEPFVDCDDLFDSFGEECEGMCGV